MADKITELYRAEAKEFGLLEEYENAEADVQEASDISGGLEELKALLWAKVHLLKIRRTIDNLKGFRMPSPDS